MNRLPKRASLVGETLSILRDGIKGNRWIDYLPSERMLAKQLQVSRPTVRTALHILQKNNWVQISHGQRTRIQGTNGKIPPQLDRKLVTFLCAKKLNQMSHSALLRINGLRERFYNSGVDFRICIRPRCFSARPDQILQSLTQETRSGCWLLYETNYAIQKWFAANKQTPCLITGITYNSFHIPCVGINQYALGRHAAGLFLARSYSNISLVLKKSEEAKDEELIAGFTSPWTETQVKTHPPIILRHNGSLTQIQRHLHPIISKDAAPAALFVGDSISCIAIISSLQKSGKRIPADIVLICRSSDMVFDYVSPSIACYTYSEEVMAHTIFQATQRILKDEPPTQTKKLLIPEFREGESFMSPSP